MFYFVLPELYFLNKAILLFLFFNSNLYKLQLNYKISDKANKFIVIYLFFKEVIFSFISTR